MSTIYAPLNSVNTYRSIRTVLPLDVELTHDEKRELMELEKLEGTSSFTTSQLAKRFNVITTTNVGIHYFCIEKSIGLYELAKNKTISTLIAYLLERKVSLTKHSAAFSVRFNLLFNPAVYNNASAFKSIFAKQAYGDSLMYALIPLLAKVNMEVFMFLIVEAGEVKTESTQVLYIKRATAREEEIYAWVAEFAPDFSDLPLSWILKAYGL